MRAYPRTCGGNYRQLQTSLESEGLSPHVRGKHNQKHGNAPLQGPIPARAGETALRSLLAHRTRAYPRTCGGNG